MARDFAKKFYSSKKWQDTRNYYFKLRNGLCERCQGIGAIVHHKIYINKKNIDDPTITLNIENLELLCRSCHEQEHKLKQDYYFDENGEIILKK